MVFSYCCTTQTEFLQDCKGRTRTTHDTRQRRSTSTPPTHGMKQDNTTTCSSRLYPHVPWLYFLDQTWPAARLPPVNARPRIKIKSFFQFTMGKLLTEETRVWSIPRHVWWNNPKNIWQNSILPESEKRHSPQKKGLERTQWDPKKKFVSSRNSKTAYPAVTSSHSSTQAGNHGQNRSQLQWRTVSKLCVAEDLIFWLNKIILKDSFAHESGHLISIKTKQMLQAKYWFP